jgi:hypothetical protein
LKEVKKIADNIRDGEIIEETNSDWQFAAMVNTVLFL